MGVMCYHSLFILSEPPPALLLCILYLLFCILVVKIYIRLLVHFQIFSATVVEVLVVFKDVDMASDLKKYTTM